MSRQSMPAKTLLVFSLFMLILIPQATAVHSDTKTPVSLTPGEQAWLRDHPTIRLGVDPDNPPLEFLGKDGVYHGIASDMVRLVNERLGISMKVKGGLTWPQVLEEAKTRMIDVVPCVSKSPDREEFLLFTAPYINVPSVLVTRTDAPYIGGMDDLSGKTVAAVQSYRIHESLRRDYPNMRLLLVNSPKEALLAVSNGIAFAYPGKLLEVHYLSPELGLSNLKVAAPTPYSSEQCFGVRKDWPEFQSILNKALAAISPEERTSISQKWTSLANFYGITYADLWKWASPVCFLLALLMLWNIQVRRQRRITKESEHRLQTIMDSVPNGVFVTDSQGRKVLVNREWERITKWASKDAIGKTYDELYPKGLAEKLHSYDRKVLDSVRPVTSEETLKTGGELRTFVHNLVPLLDSSGGAYAVCGTTTDITDRKRAEEQLQIAFAESNRLLAEAAHYVKALLPDPIDKDGIAVDWRFEPSAALGGDCFGYHWLDDDNFALYLLDVCGHGVSASLLAVTILNMLRSQTLKNTDFYLPENVLSSLNNAFPMEEQNGMYFTIWYALYQRSSRTLSYASGGHPPALLISRGLDGAVRTANLRTPNLFIGGLPAIEYEAASLSLPQPCNLYVFSDGVFEIADGDGSLWGLKTFEEFMAQSFGEKQPVLDRLMNHVRSLIRAEALDDDFSIVEIRFQ